MNETSINQCKLINLPKVHNPAGSITPLQGNKDLPFNIKRVYYLYDIPADSERGGHAHIKLYQLIVAVSGCFDVILNDAVNEKTFTLRQPHVGLLIVPGIWRELKNFSSGAISLVLASELYEEKDYIRNYKKFIDLKK